MCHKVINFISIVSRLWFSRKSPIKISRSNRWKHHYVRFRFTKLGASCDENSGLNSIKTWWIYKYVLYIQKRDDQEWSATPHNLGIDLFQIAARVRTLNVSNKRSNFTWFWTNMAPIQNETLFFEAFYTHERTTEVSRGQAFQVCVLIGGSFLLENNFPY